MRLNRWSVPILTAALIAAGSLVWRAGAQAGASAAAPAKVATVDLTRVFEGLDERLIRQDELKAYIEQQNSRLKQIGSRLEQATADLELLVVGTPERRRKSEEVVRMRVDLEVEGRFSEQLVDRRKAEVFAELFTKVEAASGVVARAQGFDLILSDDRSAAVPSNSEAETQAVMRNRRVLYAGPTVDLTDAVIRHMNNAWNAGG